MNGFLKHLKDVHGVAKSVKAKFTLVGKKQDIDLIRSREYMRSQEVTYWELVNGAFWM